MCTATYLLHQRASTKKMWALKSNFSWLSYQTKFPSGILYNSFLYDTGNFDECIKIEERNLNGKFCLALEIINIHAQSPFSLQFRLGAGQHFSLCLPETCTIRDTSILYPKLNVSAKNCYTKKSQSIIKNRTIYTIAILGVFGGIAVLSTCIDVYFHYKNYSKKNQQAANSFFVFL